MSNANAILSILYKFDTKSLFPESLKDEKISTQNFKVKLYRNNQKLIIFETKVIWLSGEVLVRQINVENHIVDCLFTIFDSQRTDITEGNINSRVLVIVLQDQIRIYDPNKSTIVVSFPMYIKSAFSYHRGIVLGKKSDSSLVQPSSSDLTTKHSISTAAEVKMSMPLSLNSVCNNESTLSSSTSLHFSPYNDGIFLTLTDPIGDFGCVVSSSTTSFSPNEEMVLFPETTDLTLAVTYDASEEMLFVYYTRYIYRSKNSKPKGYNLNSHSSRRTSKRSISASSAILNSNNHKYLDDEQRTTRIASNPMSFDRMASVSEHLNDSANANRINSTSVQETWSLKKDIIFSKIYSIPFNNGIHSLKVFTLVYKDKEALVVVNHEIGQVYVYKFEKSSNQVALSKYKSEVSIRGLDASKLDMGEDASYYIVILRADNSLVLYNPFYEIKSPSITLKSITPKAERIVDTNNYEILLKFEDGDHYSLHLHKKPLDQTVNKLMESLKYLSHDLIYENFWLHWYSVASLNIPYCDDWKLYVITLLTLCIPEKTDLSKVNPKLNEITALIPYVQMMRKLRNEQKGFFLISDMSLVSLLPKIVLSLHLIREELRLNVLAEIEYKRLSILLAQIVHWLSWSEAWLTYYNIALSTIDFTLELNSTEYISRPPNIMESLGSLFSSDLISYITFSIVAGEDDSVDQLITPRTHNVLKLFEVVISSEFENIDLVKTMVSSNIDEAELETYPPGIYFIFKNTIELCQKKLKLNWNVSAEELKLIDRNDLLFLESAENTNPSNSSFKQLSPKSTKQIVSELFNNEALTAWDGQAEADKFLVTKLLFSNDRRFYEVTKLLQTSKTQTVTYECDSAMSDHEKLIYQRSLCCKIALRTLTTPIGRGAVFNASRKPLASEGFPIPKMNFNVLILPDNINVSLEPDSISENLLNWGYFHNGASSGLSVTKNSTEISGSWIAFNKPPVLNAQHAGFLLGLGLNGHLKNLEEWHIYNYLGPKHVHTSVGLLIGMSASLKGTMSVKMTKILTVHVVAFLPPGSTNLNVPLPVQTAGIIGIGLVYLETQHRRMSEILLSQISSSIVINEKNIKNEGYNLAAGIALGYVNLGKGAQIISNTDNHLVDTLVSLSTSIRDVQTLKELDKSCSGAIMAMMLIFLKTNNLEIADKLKLPQTVQLLEYIRPDLLMLRCVARNLILWDYIKPTKEFVESQIPSCVLTLFTIESIKRLHSKILPYTNILSGALLSIALCFASTGNIDAKNTLLYYFDHLLNLGSVEPANYDERSTIIGVRNARDIAIIGLSLVMAGTGDLDVMRRLRYLQGIYDDYTRYGNYMAINMALGFLFLGGGQQAFKVGDNFSIAALITSTYPMFGFQNYEINEEIDNASDSRKNVNAYHDMHLQALRHFWALSVENRCLIVREIEGDLPVKIDVDVYLKNETIMRTPVPCLLPDLQLINKIRISSNNTYFPLEFDLLRSCSAAKEKFKKNLTLYVDRKASYKMLKLDYHDRLTLEDRMEKMNVADSNNGVSCLKNLSVFCSLNRFEKDILFESIDQGNRKFITKSTVFDFKKEIENIVNAKDMIDDEKMVNLKLVFNFVDTVVALDESLNDAGKRKRRKTNDLPVDFASLNTRNDPSEISEIIQDVNKGLYYLNVEFIEKMKKELFSKLI